MKSEEFAKRSVKVCTVNRHPGAEQRGAIGSTLAETLEMDSIGSFRASRMTVNKRLPKKRGPGGGCKEGGCQNLELRA